MSTIEERLASLTEVQRLEAQKLIEEWSKRKRQRKFFKLYPETGPHRRELYPKHTEFMSAGRESRERCFMAANRCISPWTWVETRDRTKAPAPLVFSESSAGVRAWHDEQEQSAVADGLYWRKLAPAFRVVLDNGQFFDCCRKHQVLTFEGWTSLDQLMSGVDGLRYTYKLEDYQASCVADGYLCDQPPLWDPDSGQGQLQLQHDAQKPSLSWSRTDALVRVRKYIHACQQLDLDPTEGGLRQSEALFAPFAAAATDSDVLRCSWIHPSVEPLHAAADRLLQLNGEVARHRMSAQAPLDDLTHGVSCSEITSMDALRESERLDELITSAVFEVKLPADRVPEQVSVFAPFDTPKLVGGRSIKAVVPIGYQPIIDTLVPGVNNYKAGGVYHHNCGKTVTGAYETVCHVTGRYPDWWEGYRFNKPVKFWVAGDTAKTVRDIIQVELLGMHSEHGTGMIPGEDIVRTTPKSGVPDAVDTIYIKHYDEMGDQDGVSQLQLKSYDQGRIAFQGTEQDGIWLDEECPMDVYTECLIRTMTTNGLIYLTFTPLKGLTEVVLMYMRETGAL